MNIDTAFPSKYLKASDLADGIHTPFVIEEIKIEEIGREQTKKPVIYFEGEDKAFVANKTNCNAIKKLYGSDTDEWIGKTIRLYSTEVQFGDEMVESIRVSIKPGGKAAPAKKELPPEFGTKSEDEDGVEIPFK